MGVIFALFIQLPYFTYGSLRMASLSRSTNDTASSNKCYAHCMCFLFAVAGGIL